MEEIILNAYERPMHPGKFREIGFIPGVLYGDNIAETTSVKFDELVLRKILARHGAKAKLWVKYGNTKNFGLVKEVQKNTFTGKIIHIDVQMVSKNQEIKLQIPINFKGVDHLKQRQLQLQVYKPEIDVLGKMALIPDVVHVDVSEMELGDTITLVDFDLEQQIKVTDKADEIYGTITQMKEQPFEEASVEEPVETEAKTEH